MKEYECENCLNTEYIQDKLSESYRNGYNKAIDDFIYKIQSNNSIADFMKDYLQEIAEELKS